MCNGVLIFLTYFPIGFTPNGIPFGIISMTHVSLVILSREKPPENISDQYLDI